MINIVIIYAVISLVILFVLAYLGFRSAVDPNTRFAKDDWVLVVKISFLWLPLLIVNLVYGPIYTLYHKWKG